MVTKHARDVVRAWLVEWNRRDPAVLGRWVSDDYLHHASDGSDLDFAGFAAGFEAVLRGFPDMVYTVEHLFAEDDLVGAYVVGVGTHRGAFLGRSATGRPARFAGIYHARVRGGVIVEDWDVFDLLHPALSLGVQIG